MPRHAGQALRGRGAALPGGLRRAAPAGSALGPAAPPERRQVAPPCPPPAMPRALRGPPPPRSAGPWGQPPLPRRPPAPRAPRDRRAAACSRPAARRPGAAARSPPALRAAPGPCWQPVPGGKEEAGIPVGLPERAQSGEKLAEMLFGCFNTNFSSI